MPWLHVLNGPELVVCECFLTCQLSDSQPDATVELFKVAKDGDLAVRTKVRLGRSSVSTIEVREGLQEGDTVVLSDMTQYDNAERVRLR